MASTSDDSAGYELSGKGTFSNTQCFPNATITRRARGRWVFPDIVSDTQRLELLGTVSDDLSTMNVSYALVRARARSSCSGTGGSYDNSSCYAAPRRFRVPRHNSTQQTFAFEVRGM